MRCCATSRRTSSAKWTFTSERGTWPFRKPGSRACFCTRSYARSHSLVTTSAGASTTRRRLQLSISSTATFIEASSGARGGSRTPMVVHHWILSPARLPVSPLSHRCGFHAQQNTQEEPDAARRPPFCRFTALSSLADLAEQSGPPRSSTVANPATGTHLEALPRCLAAGTITTSRPFRRVDHDAKQERICARRRSDALQHVGDRAGRTHAGRLRRV